jgi:murein DD-endopeptidase MepM/ murein hydrolase activator NlpD
MDRNMPVWAPASGQVLYAGRPSRAWQGVVVVRHTMPGGVYVDSRSAHLDQIFVSQGQWIKRGHLLGTTGRNLTDDGPGPFHLHFEICLSDLVARDPGFWPAPEDLQTVLENWTNPRDWIAARR